MHRRGGSRGGGFAAEDIAFDEPVWRSPRLEIQLFPGGKLDADKLADALLSDDWLNARGVRERIRELQERNSRKGEMTREELLTFYADVIRTPADQVPLAPPLFQAYEKTSEGGRKVRICDKVQAGAQLCRMTGWNEPERVRLSAEDSLSAYLLELRPKRLAAGRFCRLRVVRCK